VARLPNRKEKEKVDGTKYVVKGENPLAAKLANFGPLEAAWLS
jgi:hypothetical protein